MVTDIAILVGLALCQGITGYWAFHMSTLAEHRKTRWGFALLTVVGIALVVWNGIRAIDSENKFQAGQNSEFKALHHDILGIRQAVGPKTVRQPEPAQVAPKTPAAPREKYPARERSIPKPEVLLTHETDRLVLYNKGRAPFFIVGDKLDDEAADMTPPPRLVPRDAYYYFLSDRLKAWALAKLGDGAERLVPFEIYLTDENQKRRFTAKFALLLIVKNNDVSVNAQNFGVSDGGW